MLRKLLDVESNVRTREVWFPFPFSLHGDFRNQSKTVITTPCDLGFGITFSARELLIGPGKTVLSSDTKPKTHVTSKSSKKKNRNGTWGKAELFMYTYMYVHNVSRCFYVTLV